MKNIIPFHDGWNGSMRWNKKHESGLFAMEIAVHGEKQGEIGPFDAPRYWCSYLLGGDHCRWVKDGKMKTWIELDKITDFVELERDKLFNDLEWNGGVTLFNFERKYYQSYKNVRQWKVGDDYSHHWDSEDGNWQWYDFNHIMHNLQNIADQFANQMRLKL